MAAASPKNKIEITAFKNFRWINVKNNSRKEMKFLEENFKFNKQDLKDCLPPLQRPKLIKYPEYIFMILLFPYYDPKTSEIKLSEVDFFLGNNFIITVHTNKLSPLITTVKKYRDHINQEADFDINNLNLLYDILNSLYAYCTPMLTHIGNDIDTIENKIFNQFQKENIKQILLMKRNIVNFRKAMLAHKSVLRKLEEYTPAIFGNKPLGIYFENLVELTKDAWDLLENYKDTVEALHDSHVSLTTFKLNDIMKTLTVFSVIIFPLNLLASIFSMSLLNIPLAKNPHGFVVVISLMLVISIIMVLFFKKKDWL